MSIFATTRGELAIQTSQQFEALGSSIGVKCTVVVTAYAFNQKAKEQKSVICSTGQPRMMIAPKKSNSKEIQVSEIRVDMPWHLHYDDCFCSLEICVEGVTGEEKIAMNAHDLSLELVTNVNLAVSIEAIQAIGNLVCGLRTHFTGCVRVLLPILEEKLKEKKPTLAEPLIQTLQSIQLRVAKTSISVLYTKGAKKGKRGDENAPEKQGRSENQKIEAESSCQSNKNAKEMKRIWVEAVKATCLTTWD